MNREEREQLLKDTLIYFAPHDRYVTDEEGNKYYREDVTLKAMELSEPSLPPAEGAEKVQRCPVCMGKGLVPNSFYTTTIGIGSTTQTYLPEKCRTCNGAGVILPSYLQKQQQPTAEGAEEILDKYPHSIEYPSFVHENNAIAAMTEFATLHAQRIAEKMVSERLRGELIAYEEHEYFTRHEFAEITIDEYLKTREK